jgi:glucose-6-phosphate-specific signal transduction histidine kinase
MLAALREALSNAARHARASRVDVSVEADSHLRLRVSDNGIGIPLGWLTRQVLVEAVKQPHSRCESEPSRSFRR